MKSYSKQLVNSEDHKSNRTMIYVSLVLHVVEIAAIIALLAKAFG